MMFNLFKDNFGETETMTDKVKAANVVEGDGL